MGLCREASEFIALVSRPFQPFPPLGTTIRWYLIVAAHMVVMDTHPGSQCNSAFFPNVFLSGGADVHRLHIVLTTNQRWFKIIVDHIRLGQMGRYLAQGQETHGPRALRTMTKYFPVWHSVTVNKLNIIHKSSLMSCVINDKKFLLHWVQMLNLLLFFNWGNNQV